MKNCEKCRFWSEMIAQATGGRPVEAMCLADGGPKNGKYTAGVDSCHGWKDRRYGAVDDPPNYGEETRPLYERDEGKDALKASLPPAIKIERKEPRE